jgi:riboflavin biosynthesis pyrimidine reductase
MPVIVHRHDKSSQIVTEEDSMPPIIIIVLVHRHDKSSQIVTEEDSMPPIIIIVLVHRHDKSSQIVTEEDSMPPIIIVLVHRHEKELLSLRYLYSSMMSTINPRLSTPAPVLALLKLIVCLP